MLKGEKESEQEDLRVRPHKDKTAKPNGNKTFATVHFYMILGGCDSERLSKLAVSRITPFT